MSLIEVARSKNRIPKTMDNRRKLIRNRCVMLTIVIVYTLTVFIKVRVLFEMIEHILQNTFSYICKNIRLIFIEIIAIIMKICKLILFSRSTSLASYINVVSKYVYHMFIHIYINSYSFIR